MTDNRLLGADFLRAGACATVLLHHLTQRLDLDRDFGPVLNWLRSFAQFGTHGVAMFFVLSGFLLARPFWAAYDRGEPMPSLRIYAMRRGARILPGFWLALTISFILSVTVFDAVLDGALLLRFVSGVFLVADWHWLTFFPVEVNGPLWSISFEATSYALLPLGFLLVFGLRRVAPGWAGRILWVGVIGLAIYAHWLFFKTVPVARQGRGWEHGLLGGAKYWMPRYNPFALFAMFALGALAAGLHVQFARWRKHWMFDLLAVAALAWAGWTLYRHVALRDDPSGFAWLSIPYSFPAFALALAGFLATSPSSVLVGRLLDNAVSRFIATLSFGIYIWHTLVVELLTRFIAPNYTYANIKDAGEWLLLSGSITVVTVIIAWMSWRFLEEPVLLWARRHEQGGRPRLAPQAAE